MLFVEKEEPESNLVFGSCVFIRVNLDAGQVEINKLFDSSNVIVFDGSHEVDIFWFFGNF
jgi:hypothetical protein